MVESDGDDEDGVPLVWQRKGERPHPLPFAEAPGTTKNPKISDVSKATFQYRRVFLSRMIGKSILLSTFWFFHSRSSSARRLAYFTLQIFVPGPLGPV